MLSDTREFGNLQHIHGNCNPSEKNIYKEKDRITYFKMHIPDMLLICSTLVTLALQYEWQLPNEVVPGRNKNHYSDW